MFSLLTYRYFGGPFVHMQRFFRYMCMSAKVPAAVRLSKQALVDGKCVVIGLQSTGEARTEEAVTKYVSRFILHFFLSNYCMSYYRIYSNFSLISTL